MCRRVFFDSTQTAVAETQLMARWRAYEDITFAVSLLAFELQATASAETSARNFNTSTALPQGGPGHIPIRYPRDHVAEAVAEQLQRLHELNSRSAFAAQVARQESRLYALFVSQEIDPEERSNIIFNCYLYPEQERALLRWLDSQHAFRSFRLVEDLLVTSSSNGSTYMRSNAEIWGVLRNSGYWWLPGTTARPRGHWQGVNGPRYTVVEDNLTEIFEELALEGAFTTTGIMHEFGHGDPFRLFRQALNMQITWSSNRCVWTRGDDLILFGDLIPTPEERAERQRAVENARRNGLGMPLYASSSWERHGQAWRIIGP